MHFDEDLDCEGLICPLPVLRVRKRLMAMAPGAVLRVSTTDPMAVIDLPHFCAETGHEVLSRDSRGPLTLWHIRRNARGV